MKYLEGDWFVRDEIAAELDTHIKKICAVLLEKDVDYEEDVESICECLAEFIDHTRYTEDELVYAMEHISLMCVLISMTKKGLIKEMPDGSFANTELGMKVAKKMIEEEKH